jgi:ribosomal protein S14
MSQQGREVSLRLLQHFRWHHAYFEPIRNLCILGTSSEFFGPLENRCKRCGGRGIQNVFVLKLQMCRVRLDKKTGTDRSQLLRSGDHSFDRCDVQRTQDVSMV